MALNLSNLETILQNQVNNLDGTSTDKDILLTAKSIEAATADIVVSDVIAEGSTQVNAVNTAGSTQVTAVNSSGTTQVAAVNSAGGTKTGEVNTAGTTQVAAVNVAGTNQVATINAIDTYTKSETDSKIVALSPPATKAHVESLGIAASSITGALPAISGANLTGIETVTKLAIAPSNPTIGDLWMNTDNGIISVYNGTNWDQMSNIPFSATGGTVTTVGDYKIHTFTSSGIFTPNDSGNVEYLVVAGGAGAGSGSGSGGGGGGGFRTSPTFAVTAQGYTITVGAGGGPDSNGGNSAFDTITSLGGGTGGRESGQTVGTAGGSGGGGNAAWQNGGSGTAGQGNGGGSGGPYWFGGGGGGAGQSGTGGSDANSGGDGGDGLASSFSGSSVYYSGGGGGYSESAQRHAPGGNGGGGYGGHYWSGTRTLGISGTVNTGGGGGGEMTGRSGGSGIVIIRYLA